VNRGAVWLYPSLLVNQPAWDSDITLEKRPPMNEAISAILAGILLTILSMSGGAVIYSLLRDFLTHNLRKKE
jgi:hypothetical protein